MIGIEAMKALAEGKKITTKLGLMSAEYYRLNDKKTKVEAIARDGRILHELNRIPVQDLVALDDWEVYEEE